MTDVRGETPAGVRVVGARGKRTSKAVVVAFGHVSAGTCEAVYTEAMNTWGIAAGGTTQEARDELMDVLAEVLVHGTSAEIDWPAVEFTYGGAKYDMGPLAIAAARAVRFANPVRAWTRDFRKGELPFRMHELLLNPENVEMRQRVAASYETTVSNAQYCFDTSDALVSSGMVLSHSDILLIKKLSSFTIGRAQQNGIANGDVGASSNHQGTVGGSKQPNAPSTAAAASVAPPEQRANFRSLRG